MEKCQEANNKETYDIRKDQGNNVELCFEIIKDAYYFTFKNRDNLDEKASKIIVFSGIIVSLYSGLGGIILRSISKTEAIYLNKYYFLFSMLALGLFALIISILLALRAYKPESWQVVPSTELFLEKYAKQNKTKDEILGPLTSTMVDTIKNNQEKIKNKVKYINYSFIALIFGIVISVIFIFLSLLI